MERAVIGRTAGRTLMRWIFIALLLVAASPTTISLLDLHYDHGDISLEDKESFLGYYPERTQQEGHKLSVVASSGEIVYTFYFTPPTTTFIDGNINGDLGGIIVRDDFNFSLLVPAGSEDQLILTYPEGHSTSLKNPQKFPWMILLAVIIIAAGIFVVFLLRNERTKRS